MCSVGFFFTSKALFFSHVCEQSRLSAWPWSVIIYQTDDGWQLGAGGRNEKKKKRTHSPPVLRRLQLLLDVLQGEVLLGGGGDAVGGVGHGGRGLQDHLEGLARGPLVDGLDVHVCE